MSGIAVVLHKFNHFLCSVNPQNHTMNSLFLSFFLYLYKHLNLGLVGKEKMLLFFKVTKPDNCSENGKLGVKYVNVIV